MRFEDATHALGLRDDFTTGELIRAFKRAAHAHHPDRNRDDPRAIDRFLEAQRAYGLLVHHATDARVPLAPITTPIRVRCVTMGKDLVGSVAIDARRVRRNAWIPLVLWAARTCPWCTGDGEIVVGVTHDLWRDEVFGAVLGGGATLNGDRMRVSAVDHPEKMLLGLGFPSGHRRAEVDLQWVAAALREVGCVRRMGAASLDLAWLAAGRLDGFVELGLQPWDTAAGVLLVREAGGVVTGRAGEAFRPGQDWIVAANPAMHAHVLRWLAT